jgi:hypothetical protein
VRRRTWRAPTTTANADANPNADPNPDPNSDSDSDSHTDANHTADTNTNARCRRVASEWRGSAASGCTHAEPAAVSG